VHVGPGATLDLADIGGPGAIRQIWLTPAGVPWRLLILRVYWDGQEQPSVGLAVRGPLSAVAGRHFQRRVLVPDPSRGAFPALPDADGLEII
jgi:hypothetical protein